MQKRQSGKHKRLCTRKSCCECLGKAHTPFLTCMGCGPDCRIVDSAESHKAPAALRREATSRENGERLTHHATLMCGGVVHSLTAGTPCRLPGTDTNSWGCGGHMGQPNPLATTEAHPRTHTRNSATAMQRPRPACAPTLATTGCS